MTTRAVLADDTTFDYDEETQAHPTHVNDQAVVRRVFTGPTPEKGAVPEETDAQKRDRLRAELAALDDEDEDEAPAPKAKAAK
jgi:hypothetical protein